MGSDSSNTILYELICCAEWNEDKEEEFPFPSLSTCKSGLLSYVSPTSFFRKKPLTPLETALWTNCLGPSWQYAVTSDGKIISVLQDSMLETRSSRDNFSSVLGKAYIPKDEFPNFRRMVWSKDSALLAVSFTNGLIICFDVMASQMFSVRRSETGFIDENMSFSLDQCLAGIFFVDERIRKTTFCSELVTVDKRGIVQAFRQVNPDEMEFHHEGSLREYYPFGVNYVQYAESHGILLVAGNLVQDSSNLQRPNWKHGISAWRLLLDYPYYRILFTVDTSEFRMDARRLWKTVKMLATSQSQDLECVQKLSLSPNGTQMAAIHISGAISIWQIPSLKLNFFWPLKSQFQYNIGNSKFNSRWRNFFNQSQQTPMDPLMFHPYDISWWDDESLIIARCNGTLTLTPISGCPSKNLLGDSPEFFESPVRTSSRYEKSFFVLEAEVRQKMNANGNSDQEEAGESWIKSVAKEIIFGITDIERFRPRRKTRKKLPTYTHSSRFFTVRNITPQELFYRKIEHEEYGEALDLAKLYKLDSDLVYQRQWTKNPVSVHTIKDFLAKITKRNWVLQECLDRVPDSVDAARELLNFGLKGTDVTVAVLISQGKDKGRFILWTPDDLNIAREEYLSLVDIKNEEVIRLLRYRKRFLHFMEVLNTYEELVGPKLIEEKYNSKEYGALRSRNIVDCAVEMARNCDTKGLQIVLRNHWEDVSNDYLEILSSFPETWSPHGYKSLLPRIEDENVILWTDIAIKNSDWCDEFLQKVDAGLTQINLREMEVTREKVFMWYERRIREIESFSSLINNALDLGLHGIERNVDELQTLVQDLSTLETMVYEVQLENMTLGKLKTLSDIEKINLLLSNSTETTLVTDFRYYVLPFVLNCEDKVEGSSFRLLNQYLTSISANDLNLALKIFEASKSDEFDPLITDEKDLMMLAHNCIYTCQNPEEATNVLAILACLPEHGHLRKSQSMENLHNLIDDLEAHFSTVQILQKYSVILTVEKMKQISNDDTKSSMEELLVNLCLSASKIYPPLKISDWKGILHDILEIRKKLFMDFEIERCFEIYVSALLKSGSAEAIKLAKEFLEKSPSPKVVTKRKTMPSRQQSSEYSSLFSLFVYIIPYSKGLDMVIDSAQMYFDSSSNYADPDMELSKVCLNLIQDPKEPRVASMFDLVDAVKLLNKDFRLNVLPHAVRICEDKLNLVRQAVETSKGGYKKIQQLLKLVIFLHIDALTMEEAESTVLEMAGNVAMKENDLKMGVQICQKIMAKQYKTGWKVFTTLSQDHSDPPLIDQETVSSFINYALTICPNSEIATVLIAKYTIEIRNIQDRLMELSFGDDDAKVYKLMLEVRISEMNFLKNM